jgi:hypothetical protein
MNIKGIGVLNSGLNKNNDQYHLILRIRMGLVFLLESETTKERDLDIMPEISCWEISLDKRRS